MDKVDAQVCNKRLIESLVKAGAFDDMKHKRRALMLVFGAACFIACYALAGGR